MSVALSACGGGGSTAAAKSASGTTTVTVAVIDPLSGDLAASGEAALNGAKAGAAYLNAGNAKAKGVHYVIISRDSQASPTTDAALARQLTQQGIRFFIGDDLTSTGFAAEQPVFNQVNAISFSSVPGVFSQAGVGTAYPGIFGDGGGEAHYVTPFINYLKGKTNGKLAILYANYQDVAIWGQMAATDAKADGITPYSEAVPLTASDVTAQLRMLQSSGANALLAYALTPTMAGAVAEGLNQIGWSPSVLVLEGVTSQVAEELPAALRNDIVDGPRPLTFMASSTAAQPTGLAAEYLKYYAPLAGEKAGAYDSQVTNGNYYFDAMLILDQAIAKAGSTNPQAVEKALDSGTTFQGASGAYQYGPDNRGGPLNSDFGLYKFSAAGCPTGICENAAG